VKQFWRIYLLPQYWGKGYADEIFNWGINEIKQKGYKRIMLWVIEDNFRARKFYEKNQFCHDGTKIQVERGKQLSELLYIRSI
jgi:RimJ/RimL family protein N-acetyltransferase